MNDDARIERVLQLVLRLASGDLDARVEPLGIDDPLDGVTEGLNMLGEELSASMAALRRSEEGFRTLIEQSPDAIVVHREEHLIYINEAMSSLVGYRDKSDLTGERVGPLFSFDQDIDTAQRSADASGSGAPAKTRDARMVHRDGSILNVEVASIPIVFDGNPATLTTVRDVSARKQFTAKMMELDRMIAVGTLAAGVGHEINNPLAYVITNLEYAIERLKTLAGSRARPFELTKEFETLFEALFEAHHGADRVRQIVTDLKNFSRSHGGAQKRFELRPVLESAINMAFNEIRHRAQLVRDFEGTTIVFGNPSRLGQVFLNLLINAAHSIPEGAAHDNRILVRTRTTPEGVRIEITDSGVGIESAHIPRLFDPFFTTKSVDQGTGLGLYICRRTVNELGGEIEIESAPGSGSTFRVLLPRHDEKPIETVSLPKAHTRDALESARILIVDDEPNICRSLVRLIGLEHDVSSVTDAKQALTQFLDGVDYDLVLCDIMMPDMTGIELYNETRRRVPEMAEKIYFFTGGALTASGTELLEKMPERCFEKPLDMERIRQTIRDCLEAKREQDTSRPLQRHLTLRGL